MKKTKPELTGRRHRPEETANSRPAERNKNRRESIESFVVVFVAFLVWSFEAEGFVIPTGSMAPDRSWAGTRRSSAPSAAMSTRSTPTARSIRRLGCATGIRVTWGTCENCRFENPR